VVNILFQKANDRFVKKIPRCQIVVTISWKFKMKICCNIFLKKRFLLHEMYNFSFKERFHNFPITYIIIKMYDRYMLSKTQ